MGELNAGDGALPFDEARDPLERLEVFVAPDAKVLRGDPPFGRDRRRFGENQGRRRRPRAQPNGRSANHWQNRLRTSIGTSEKRRCDWQA